MTADPSSRPTVADAALACRNLQVTLGDTPIVKDVSLEVGAGEWLTVIGPNGAGKSTLLRALLGLVPFDGGVQIAGRDGAQLSPRERAQRVAFVPQHQTLPTGMKVLDYVLLGRNPWLAPLGRESAGDIDIARDALAGLDALQLHARAVEDLSGGERQRVVIARAIAQQAPVLVLDEPTTSLDIGHQQELLAMLESLRRTTGLTLLTTLHDLTLAGVWADRLVLLSDGRIVAYGDPATVLTEDNITNWYRAEVRIIRDGDGTIIVVPAPPSKGDTP